MDTKRLKNFIIIILAVLNLTLGVVLVADRVKSRSMYRQELGGISQILEQNGISVSAQALDYKGSLAELTVSRDLEEERRGAAAVLGELSVADQGGNILFYDGEYGQAVMRGAGDFQMLFASGRYSAGRDAVEASRDFARRLGLETSAEVVASSVQDGSGSVTLLCESGGAVVANCRLTFTYANGALMLVVGTRPLDNAVEGASAPLLELPSVLMRFLEIVRSGGHVCSELQGVRLCYIQSASAAGSGRLVPVWEFETDSGEFYINAATGRQESVS